MLLFAVCQSTLLPVWSLNDCVSGESHGAAGSSGQRMREALALPWLMPQKHIQHRESAGSVAFYCPFRCFINVKEPKRTTVKATRPADSQTAWCPSSASLTDACMYARNWDWPLARQIACMQPCRGSVRPRLPCRLHRRLPRGAPRPSVRVPGQQRWRPLRLRQSRRRKGPHGGTSAATTHQHCSKERRQFRQPPPGAARRLATRQLGALVERRGKRPAERARGRIRSCQRTQRSSG